MTEELYHLWYSLDEDAHGWIVFSTENFTGSMGFSGFTDITRGGEKHLKCFPNI